MLSIQQIFNIIRDMINANCKDVIKNTIIIRDLFNEYCNNMEHDDTSTIKLSNCKKMKTYFIKGKYVIEIKQDGTNSISYTLNDLGYMIFDDIFIENMKFIGCDYLLNTDVNYLFNNITHKKIPNLTMNDCYKSFYDFVNNGKFVNNNSHSSTTINNRILLICAIASKIAYDENIIPRYVSKRVSDGDYVMIKNSDMTKNNYDL